MMSVDEYLSQARGAMVGMGSSVRDDILRELRSHLAESTAANGGNVARALANMGPAADVGRRYRHLYGFGRGFKALFIAIAGVLGILSSPVLQGAEEYYIPNLLSFPALVILIGFLLWASVRAGSRAGLYAGSGACAARVLTVVALALIPPGAAVTDLGSVFLAVSSALLILLGWLPGTVKKAWTKAGAEL